MTPISKRTADVPLNMRVPAATYRRLVAQYKIDLPFAIVTVTGVIRWALHELVRRIDQEARNG